MNRHNFLFLIAFLALLTLPGLVWGASRLVSPHAFETDLSEQEKRSKAEIKWSELFSDCSSINDWYQDRAPFRDQGITLYQGMNQKLESGYEQKLIPVFSKLVSQKKQNSQPGTRPDTAQRATLPVLTPLSPRASEAESPAEQSSAPQGSASNGCAHQYEMIVLTEPTCTQNGTGEYTCRLCGDSYGAIVPATGHQKELIAHSDADFEHWGYNDYRCTVCGAVMREDVQNKKVDDSFLSPRTVGEGVIIGRYNWLFYTGNDSVAYYKGSNLLSEEELQTYAAKVNQLASLCAARNITLCLFFPPNKEQVYREYMPTYTIENEYKRTQRLVDYLSQHTSVPVVYPLEMLRKADLYHTCYHLNDTHWNHYGAFVGTMEEFRALGLPVVEALSLDLPGSYEDTTGGDLISLGGLRDAGYPSYKDFFPKYLTGIQILDESYIGNNEVYRCTTDNPNGKKLVCLGDSFRVMQLDYLRRSFTQSLISHRDYLSQYMKDEILACDYLILETVERVDTRVFQTIDGLIGMLSQ